MSDFATLYIVDGALFVLAAFSVLTWILILHKAYVHWRLASENRRFTAFFWKAAERDPTGALGGQLHAAGSKARVARAGFAALSSAAPVDADSRTEFATWDRQEVLERFLAQQIQRERRGLERGLTLLASIANVAPFVGLFGTVFGIIHALHALAAGTTGGVEAIAGPVGQALVATGVGIAVAIPAVLAYNLFLRRLRVTVADLDDYATDLVNLARCNGFRISFAADTLVSTSLPSHTGEVRA
ncbi:MotA/TolQ/ExbB proton channel family protein [Caballeronia sp. LjRoot29]|uniref:MotA/TolQ/ExbB proton channel family protein n=1 Tax=Caballeronia sp. LjRoot29 TaxID=3342315 RepID=UPI003ECF3C07